MATWYIVTILILSSVEFLNSTTFENVALILTSRGQNFYYHGRPPIEYILVKNDDSLEYYVNHQPLETVVIHNQNIPKLTTNSVSNLPDIVEIVIISSGIQEIEHGTFKNLPQLLYLNLSGNLLEEISNGVFSNLSLDTLDLANNKIATLGEKVFNNMTLKLIILNNNKISTWKSSWFDGTLIDVITLSNNQLEALPNGAFQFASKLHSHNASNYLRRLILSGNRINKIDPNAFKGLDHLGFVSFRNNSIQSLPMDVFASVEINTLDLSHNKISQMGEAFKNISIDHLDLRNNRLGCLAFDFLDTSTIYYIYIDGNPLICECMEKWRTWQNRYYVMIKSWDENPCIRPNVSQV